MSHMKVAVTGSNGLIGRAVVRALLAAGHAPITVDRERADLVGDICEASFARAVASSGDAVVHLAGRRAAVSAQRARGFDLLVGNLSVDISMLKADQIAKVPGIYAITVSI